MRTKNKGGLKWGETDDREVWEIRRRRKHQREQISH